MSNSTSNTYKMKREILYFSNQISRKFPKPDRKINVVDRLSKHLPQNSATAGKGK